ncbi:LysR family transcriptional regulator [Tropicimonas sp. IMCC34043]|uniref:LysR family transcriptional regulator n=1 Tax=Tropicimonas sp. IMCC34043 TaxID=2248760 RepID=UPI000E2799C0|nr:LysR family transcriptional regulator [Tropicimonas sp. IMCC34043]
MEIRNLETFLEVVERGSVAEAARRMNLTPAALSQRLLVLEQELGQTLVTRVGRTMQPTEEGLAMLAAARRVVSGARDLRAIAANGEPAGQLRLGAIATSVTGLLPEVIVNLSQAHPSIEYFVQPGSSADLYQFVMDGDLDAAIIVRPNFALHKSLHWQRLRTEPLVFLSPEESAPADPHDLMRAKPFIRYDRNSWGGRIIDRYLRAHGLVVKEFLELDGLEAIAAMVNRGVGVALVPDWMPPWPAGLRLRKTIVSVSDSREIGVVWRSAGARNAAVGVFVEACTAVVADATSRL